MSRISRRLRSALLCEQPCHGRRDRTRQDDLLERCSGVREAISPTVTVEFGRWIRATRLDPAGQRMATCRSPTYHDLGAADAVPHEGGPPMNRRNLLTYASGTRAASQAASSSVACRRAIEQCLHMLRGRFIGCETTRAAQGRALAAPHARPHYGLDRSASPRGAYAARLDREAPPPLRAARPLLAAEPVEGGVIGGVPLLCAPAS